MHKKIVQWLRKVPQQTFDESNESFAVIKEAGIKHVEGKLSVTHRAFHYANVVRLSVEVTLLIDVLDIDGQRVGPRRTFAIRDPEGHIITGQGLKVQLTSRR